MSISFSSCIPRTEPCKLYVHVFYFLNFWSSCLWVLWVSLTLEGLTPIQLISRASESLVCKACLPCAQNPHPPCSTTSRLSNHPAPGAQSRGTSDVPALQCPTLANLSLPPCTLSTPPSATNHNVGSAATPLSICPVCLLLWPYVLRHGTCLGTCQCKSKSFLPDDHSHD